MATRTKEVNGELVSFCTRCAHEWESWTAEDCPDCKRRMNRRKYAENISASREYHKAYYQEHADGKGGMREYKRLWMRDKRRRDRKAKGKPPTKADLLRDKTPMTREEVYAESLASRILNPPKRQPKKDKPPTKRQLRHEAAVIRAAEKRTPEYREKQIEKERERHKRYYEAHRDVIVENKARRTIERNLANGKATRRGSRNVKIGAVSS